MWIDSGLSEIQELSGRKRVYRSLSGEISQKNDFRGACWCEGDFATGIGGRGRVGDLVTWWSFSISHWCSATGFLAAQ
jgi:hypothetical protein